VVLEKTPIDEDFDQRHGVNAGRMADGSGWGVVPGSFGGTGPAAWIDDYDNRVRHARADYTRDHPGAPKAGLAELAPYIDPPLDPAKLQKLINLELKPKR
jgi:hypothetical protein